MSFERSLPGAGMGAEPPIAPGPVESTGDGSGARRGAGLPPALRLQILATEHWSLLASRSLAWNESFSRAGMFLATLSGAIVALALVAQATEFGEGFRIFGLVILPVVLFVGVGTTFRIGMSNYHDARTVMGMNRIRAAYLEMDPDLGRYFVMGVTEDEVGRELTMGLAPRTPLFVQMIASSPMLITVLDGVVAGAIVALAALQIGAGTATALVGGVLGGLLVIAVFLAYAQREIRMAVARQTPTAAAPGSTSDAA
jgi:hypothetical protein